MGSFTFQIKGLTELQGRLDRASQKLIRSIDADLKDGAQQIAKEAKVRAPGDFGTGLRQGIGSAKVADMRYSVYSNAFYSAYVEFGTGTKVFLSSLYSFGEEEKLYALQFFVNGLGRLPAHPYFFPAFSRQKPIIIQNVKNSMQDALEN